LVKTDKGPGTGGQGTKPTSGAGGNRRTTSPGGNRPANTGGAAAPNNRRRFKPKVKTTSKKQPMLNMHKIKSFKYDMNTVLSESTMDEDKASSFLATIIAKASRNSTKEAKIHVKTFLDEGDLMKKEHDEIIKLLDKYSRYR
jgi:hypothetical protein